MRKQSNNDRMSKLAKIIDTTIPKVFNETPNFIFGSQRNKRYQEIRSMIFSKVKCLAGRSVDNKTIGIYFGGFSSLRVGRFIKRHEVNLKDEDYKKEFSDFSRVVNEKVREKSEIQ